MIEEYRNMETGETEDGFRLRAYRKSELAMLYFPHLARKEAVCKLKRWIDRCTPLRRELDETEYPPDLRRFDFTPKEVRLIVRHLGEP